MCSREREDIAIVVDEYCVWSTQPVPDAPVDPSLIFKSEIAVEHSDPLTGISAQPENFLVQHIL